MLLAEAIYLGGGPAAVSLDSHHEAIGRQSLSGGQLLWGWEAEQIHGFELVLGGTGDFPVDAVDDPFYPPDDAEYLFMAFNYRYHLRRWFPNRLVPYLGVGWSYHSVQWVNYVYDQSGAGLSLNGGLRFYLEGPWAIELDISRQQWSGERIYYSSGTRDPSGNTTQRIGLNLLWFLTR